MHDYADLYPFETNVSFDERLNDNKNYNRYLYVYQYYNIMYRLLSLYLYRNNHDFHLYTVL